ncbi:MAG: hypothetical protein DRR08_22680 [Candidatus Parabeggiatoa sp. nov. 2]|nr:MAG: hypothetical protein DRR08_22680 [Gammaproteobacteria bacterium]
MAKKQDEKLDEWQTEKDCHRFEPPTDLSKISKRGFQAVSDEVCQQLKMQIDSINNKSII